MVTSGVAAAVGLGGQARAQVGTAQMVFRLSTRNTRTCNACRQHARHKIFETFFVADTNRAHPGCNCPITFQSITSALIDQLAALDTRQAGVWDIRSLPSAPVLTTRHLVAGWNLIGVPANVGLDDLITALSERFAAIFVWDAPRQQFLSYHVGVPDQANSLGELQGDRALWIQVPHPDGAQLSLSEAGDASGMQLVELSLGWNLVPWRGADGSPALEATRGLGDALDVLYTWNAATQRFASYLPRFPQLNDAPVELGAGEGIWLRVNRETEWSQSIA